VNLHQGSGEKTLTEGKNLTGGGMAPGGQGKEARIEGGDSKIARGGAAKRTKRVKKICPKHKTQPHF